MNTKNRSCKIILLILVIVFLWLLFFNPLVFMRDGLLTKTKVESFGQQYTLGRTRRHTGEYSNIYMVSFGIKQPEVYAEYKNGEDFKGEPVQLDKIAPGLYTWKWDHHTAAYRVVAGKYKFYYTIVVA